MKPAATRHTDALIVGAGPIGLATAIALKQRQVDAVVLERGCAPYDKACGEGIMPAGRQALAALGVDLDAAPSMPFAGIRYIDGDYEAAGYFGTGLGLGIRRTTLTQVLRARAETLGISLIDNCCVQAFAQDSAGVRIETTCGIWHTSIFIGADGLHSAIRDQLGLAASKPVCRRRFGLRQHFACAPWSPFVDVYWAAGAEAYVTPISPHCVGVAFLWGPEPARFDALLARFPALKTRLHGAAVASRMRGAGALAQPVICRYKGRVALVGDAAGYLDALTGEGLTLGLHSAQALAQVVAEARPLKEYERAYRALSKPYYREASLLLALVKRPYLRRMVMRLLARFPRIMQAFVTAHSERRLIGVKDFRSPKTTMTMQQGAEARRAS